MAHHLDEIDITILDILQNNSRIKRKDLAETTGLSIPSITDRLNKLQDNGYIKDYLTRLDHKKFGKDITAFIFVLSDSSAHYKEFLDQAVKTPEVIECHSITGDGSHILKIRTDNTATLEKLLSKIQSWKGVRSTRTSISLSCHKESFFLDLKNNYNNTKLS
jgi:Lrp/AsnC family leucine-responsive transcriptional regulator